MKSNLNIENSSEIRRPKTKYIIEVNNNEVPELISQELNQIQRNDLKKLPENDEKSAFKRKTKSFDPSYKERSNLYGTIFSDSKLNQFNKINSSKSLSSFDLNSNFDSKNFKKFSTVDAKKDSNESWFLGDSKILEKLEVNSNYGRNFTSNFNDSSLFAFN
jgi:hypothetical protein